MLDRALLLLLVAMIVLVIALAGCSRAVVFERTPDRITIAGAGLREANRLASEHCAETDRYALFDRLDRAGTSRWSCH